MEVRNCRSCGRLFNYMGGAPLCPACQKKLEEKFQEVKAFLEENPNSSVETVAEELDVSVKQIRQWIREERLRKSQELLADSNMDIQGIAELVGFNSAANFTTAFRQRLGMTPSKYRSHARSGDEVVTEDQSDS